MTTVHRTTTLFRWIGDQADKVIHFRHQSGAEAFESPSGLHVAVSPEDWKEMGSPTQLSVTLATPEGAAAAAPSPVEVAPSLPPEPVALSPVTAPEPAAAPTEVPRVPPGQPPTPPDQPAVDHEQLNLTRPTP